MSSFISRFDVDFLLYEVGYLAGSMGKTEDREERGVLPWRRACVFHVLEASQSDRP
jgi:hypothetical protein